MKEAEAMEEAITEFSGQNLSTIVLKSKKSHIICQTKETHLEKEQLQCLKKENVNLSCEVEDSDNEDCSEYFAKLSILHNENSSKIMYNVKTRKQYDEKETNLISNIHLSSKVDCGIQPDELSYKDIECHLNRDINEIIHISSECAAYNSKAMNLWKSGHTKEAEELWTNMMNNHVCGLTFYNFGIAQSDPKKALYYFQKAAQEGHVKGMYNAAAILLEDASLASESFNDQAELFLKSAADCGLKEAQTNLAAHYLIKNENVKYAVSLLEKASEQKCTDAMYYLGTCYENGLGVDKDDHKAAELYEQASKGGQMDATINLAVFYWHGRGGLIVCKEKASSLLSHVEEFGDASAIEYVKDLQFKLNKDCL